MRCLHSLSCISATIGCFAAPLAVHPLPGGTSLQLEKGGRGFVRSSPWYRLHVFRWALVGCRSDPSQGGKYALDSSYPLCLVVRGVVGLDLFVGEATRSREVFSSSTSTYLIFCPRWTARSWSRSRSTSRSTTTVPDCSSLIARSRRPSTVSVDRVASSWSMMPTNSGKSSRLGRTPSTRMRSVTTSFHSQRHSPPKPTVTHGRQSTWCEQRGRLQKKQERTKSVRSMSERPKIRSRRTAY